MIGKKKVIIKFHDQSQRGENKRDSYFKKSKESACMNVDLYYFDIFC